MTIKTDAELKQENPELYRIAREQGTEAPNSSDILFKEHDGSYHCAVCDNPLFKSDTKFESGSGWPSFTNPISLDAVKTISDNTHGMSRTEVRCAVCDAHLGHVFNDGPKKENGENHNRFCVNGTSLGYGK